MNVLCVVAGRGNSKRVPNKNIRMLLGKPLIAYTIEKALESKLSSKVVVSTDDFQIAKVAEGCGVEVIIRPDDLALDTSPIDDALRHAVRSVEGKDGFVTDIAVLLQADVPIRKDGEIDEVVSRLINNNELTAVATAYVVEQRPEWMKRIDSKTGLIRPFMEPTNLYRKQDLPELYLLEGAVIAIRKKVLMETEGMMKAHGYMGDKVSIVTHEAKYAIGIEEERDFELAEFYLNKDRLKKK